MSRVLAKGLRDSFPEETPVQGGSFESARLLGGGWRWGPMGRTAGEVGGNRSVRASLQECRRHWGLLNIES